MTNLPIFVRLEGRPIILIGTGAAADAKRRLIERAGGVVAGEEAQAALAIVVEDEAAVVRLKARGVLVNAVDRPDLCDFTLPAIVDRAPVLVAIGTGGISAGLAANLRQRLETILPPGLGRVAQALHAARDALRACYPDAGDRRRAIGALLAEGGALDPLVEHARPTVAADSASADRIERVAVTSPDPDLLSLRAARLLGQADRLFHDPRVPAAILDRARADAERIVCPAPTFPPSGLSVDLVWEPR